MKFLLLFIFCFSIVYGVHALKGLPDAHFGHEGFVAISLGNKIDHGEIIAIQKDGKIILAGTADFTRKNNFALVRTLPDGSPDLNFGKEGKVTTDLGGKDTIFGLLVQHDGKILAAGFTHKKGKADFALVRTLSDGSLDLSFGRQGTVVSDTGEHDEIHYLALQPDKKIVAAGFSEKKNKSSFVVARYLENGAPDPSFGQNGYVFTHPTINDKLYSVALDSKGFIIAVGSVSFNQTSDECAVVRYQPDGRVDTHFGDRGLVRLGSKAGQSVCSSLAIQSNEKIIFAGYARKNKKNADFLVGRLMPDGTFDESFGEGGISVTNFEGGNDVAHDIALDTNGKIILAGEYSKKPKMGLPFFSGFALARYRSDGILDESFGKGGKLTPDFKSGSHEIGLSMARDFHGRVVMGGAVGNHFGLVRVK